MSVHAGIDRKTEGKDVQEGLDVEVVGGEDDFKEHLLVDLDKLAVPVRDLGRLAAGVVLILGEGFGVLFVVFAPLEDLFQDVGRNVGQRDRLVRLADICGRACASGQSYCTRT